LIIDLSIRFKNNTILLNPAVKFIFSEVNVMQQAAYGTYRNGQIFFDAPAPAMDNAKVVVVFLDEPAARPKLTDIFSLYGAWEDTRTVDEIISEIRNDRTCRADLQL
jgi:hypothetical protein